jgi:hypothetical protein
MNEVNPAKLDMYVNEIKANLDENNMVDSLVKELAALKLTQDELVKGLASAKSYITMRDILLPEAKLRYEGIHQVKIVATMPLKAEKGFYGIEHDEKGEPFRWTGPQSSFFFDLHLCRTAPLKFNISLARWGTAPSNTIRCFSDNYEIPLIRTLTNSTISYTGILLPREVLGVTRLEFSVAKMFRSNPNNNSSPLLGVVFTSFTVDPATKSEVDAHLDACNTLSTQDNELLKPANATSSDNEG